MTVRARKRFGQHFLHDKNVITRIINQINLQPAQTMVEIGPGTGALTFPLLEQVAKLHAIEIDRDLAQLLQTRVPADRLTIHCVDVLKFEFCKHFESRLNVVGNLPYNISTPLIFHLLDQASCIDQMIFMLQKEVAERICAEPGSNEYGRLSIMVQSQCQVEWLFNVSADSFSPPPKVESAVIKLYPGKHTCSSINDRKLFNELVRTAFSKRRKTIRNALKSLVPEQILLDSGITLSSRPEELPVETYINLANALQQVRQS